MPLYSWELSVIMLWSLNDVDFVVDELGAFRFKQYSSAIQRHAECRKSHRTWAATWCQCCKQVVLWWSGVWSSHATAWQCCELPWESFCAFLVYYIAAFGAIIIFINYFIAVYLVTWLIIIIFIYNFSSNMLCWCWSHFNVYEAKYCHHSLLSSALSQICSGMTFTLTGHVLCGHIDLTDLWLTVPLKVV